MKKIILIMMTIFLFPAFSFCQTYVYYRLSSGEVEDIESEPLVKNSLIFGEAVDPSFPDGMNFNSPDGDADVLGYAKIYDNGVVRNATQGEIDGFAAARLDDKNKIQAEEAKLIFQNDPQLRRILKAFADIVLAAFSSSLTDFATSAISPPILFSKSFASSFKN